jgi:multicomponent Na+:H+ antiporter subunit E
MKRASASVRLLALAQRAGLLALLWWALAEGQADAWLFGMPVIAAAALASIALQPRPWRIRPFAALGALGWFLRRALAAGFDVALRAMAPRPRLAPGFVTLRSRLGDPAARVLLANALSLLPGTLSAGLHGAELELHLLDRDVPVEGDVREMEARIAAALGLELEEH